MINIPLFCFEKWNLNFGCSSWPKKFPLMMSRPRRGKEVKKTKLQVATRDSVKNHNVLLTKLEERTY